MAIVGTTPVTARIAPTDAVDTYATHEAQWGKGGYMSVASNDARDAITTARREEGMLVFVRNTAATWRLAANLTTWNPVSALSATGAAILFGNGLPNGSVTANGYALYRDVENGGLWSHDVATESNTGWNLIVG